MAKYLKKFETHSEYLAFTQTSDFIKPNVSYCVQDNEVHYNPYVHDYSEDYLTFVALESGTFTFTPISINIIRYSTDNGTTWTPGNSVSVNSGDKVLWKGAMTPEEYQGIGTFSSTGDFDVQGNPMSLLFRDDYKEETNLTGKNFAFYNLFYDNTKVINAKNLSLPATTLAEHCYGYMFQGCTSLTTAPELPATALAEHCYGYMFQGCTSLTTAPELPATTLASNCYNSMFYNCTSLTTAPELPATTLAEACYSGMFRACISLTTAPELPAITSAEWCYSDMFANCTNLTTAPELPAATLANNCYSGMFRGCTNLTTAPELSAETLAGNCYHQMFKGCTSLVTAPELPAETLAGYCYSEMFRDCTSLTTVPELPATTLANGCYNNMFNGCANLNYIKAMFTTTPSSTYTYRWVYGVAASGTFVKNVSATWNVTGADGIPTGWTVQKASA